MTVYGIDFSGARDAARRTWITRLDGDAVAWVKPEAELGEPLADFVAGVQCPVGIDVPLGLPAGLLEDGWEAWAHGFAERFATSEEFRDDCRRRAGGERKRAVEKAAKAPFAAWNLRMYRQTWRVMREIVSPLLRQGRVIVVPQQTPRPGVATLIEVCPASTLHRLGIRAPYKRHAPDRRAARVRLAREFGAPDIAVEDAGGDALDSVIAARAVAEAVQVADWTEPVPGEGRVYF